MAKFDVEEFKSLASDIERYLGWLKGNELAQEWLDANRFTDSESTTEDGATNLWWFRSIAPEGQFSVTFREPKIMLASGQHHEWAQKVQQVWESGAAWTEGVAEYLYSLCIDVARPNADALHASVVAVQKAGDQLQGAIVPDWTGLNLESWVGESHDAFQGTIDTFAAKLSDQYLAYWRHSEASYAAACAILVQIQSGLIPFMTAMRDGVREQLTGWVALGGPPQVNKIDPKLVDAAKVVSKIVGMVPVVGDVKGKIEDGVEITNGILGLFMDEPVKLPDDFEMRTSDSIYIDITTSLTDAFARGVQSGYDTLRAEATSSALHAQQGMNPWFTPRYSNAADEPWKHAYEK